MLWLKAKCDAPDCNANQMTATDLYDWSHAVDIENWFADVLRSAGWQVWGVGSEGAKFYCPAHHVSTPEPKDHTLIVDYS